MASVLLHHVVGDLTVGKPELVEFEESETVEAAIRAIGDCAEGAITVWRRRQPAAVAAAEGAKAARFVGILNSLDVVAFLAAAGDHDKVLRTPVAEVVSPNPALLKEVDPGTRLIDALEMMKQGVRRLLVRKSLTWRGVSKRFSILYNGKWLKNINTADACSSSSSSRPSSSSDEHKFCCLSREDVVRFLIGCLGALAPIPLTSISALGAINPFYSHVEASSPALDAVRNLPKDPCAIAVVEASSDGAHKIVGEISAYKLWKCDYLAAAWAMANLSAGQFVTGAEDDNADSTHEFCLANFSIRTSPSSPDQTGASSPMSRPKKFSSRSMGFFSNPPSPTAAGMVRSMFRGRSAPLTCKHTSSLAAVMAQMLSHRATHVWVTEAESDEDDVLVGVVSYSDILLAVTKHPGSVVSTTP